MGKYKFYIFKAKIAVILLTILSLGLFALYYIPKQGAGMVAFVPVSLLLFFAMTVFLLTWSWPVVKDQELEIRWLLLPLLNREYRYADIQKIVFKADTRYAFVMSIIRQDGKTAFWGVLDCMPVNKIQEFLDDLRLHGVVVDNQTKYRDII